ncbi:MAG TPA: MFS transporter [Streptosporangiaceae bacterium]|jgi:MFS family permease
MSNQGPRGPQLLRPLAIRDFRLLWAGQVVSLIGDGLFTVALAWQSIELSPRPATLSVVLVARSVPQLTLALLGGALSDRLPRRALMLVSDLVRGAAVAAIAALAGLGVISVWQLVCLAAVFGAADALFQPAYASIIPDILPGDLLLEGNALNTSARLLALQMAGPLLGGVAIAAIGVGGAFWADAGSFAFSVGCLVAMRTRRTIPAPARGIAADIGDGLRLAYRIRWLWTSLIVSAGVNLFVLGPLTVIIPVLLRERLHAGAGTFGLVPAAFGLGGAAAAVIVAQASWLPRRASAMYLGWGGSGIAFAAIGLVPRLWPIVALIALAGFGLAIGNLLWITMVQHAVPNASLGKIASLDWLIGGSAIPLSIAASAPLSESLGAPATIMLAGLLTAACAVVPARVPGALDGALPAPGQPPGQPQPGQPVPGQPG